MKKILHIQVLPKLSGVQKISLEIFKALPDTSYEKWILFSNDLDAGDKAACKEAFEKTNAKVIFSNKLKREIGFSDFGAIKEIYHLCKQEQFDIVHTHSTKPGIIGRIAATLAHVPLVIHTVHGLAFHQFVKFPKWQFYWACEMFASMFCHKIIMVNKFYGKWFKWFKKKTTTIYNGTDFSQLHTFPKPENEHVKILFVGRLDEPKDPITILKAAKIITNTHPNTQFTLVGDGEKYGECQTFIESNNLQKNVTLAGWQNDVSRYYVNHDIFFAPSIYESFGLMFVEAGYYNLPTVSTNVEGIPEVIEDGVTGFLCNPRDEVHMAEKLIALIENQNLRLKIGQQSYQRVTSMFSNSQMTSQYIRMYNNE